MPSLPFDISSASDRVKLDSSRHGSSSITIKNKGTTPFKVTPYLKALGSTKKEWLTVEGGETDKSFSSGEIQTFTVVINVAKDASPGTYEFRLNLVNADKSSASDSAEGPSVGFVIESKGPAPTPSKWWIYVVIALIAVVGAVGMFALLKNHKPSAPGTVPSDFEGKPLSVVVDQLKSAGLDWEVRGTRVTADGSKPEGIILEQSPKKGQPLPSGAKLQFTLEGPSIMLTDYRGSDLSQVMQSMSASGLGVKLNAQNVGSQSQVNKIQSQNPPGNNRVAPGTTIAFNVGALNGQSDISKYQSQLSTYNASAAKFALATNAAFMRSTTQRRTFNQP